MEWSGIGGGLIIMWFSPPPFCRDEGGRLLLAEAVVFVTDSSTDRASEADAYRGLSSDCSGDACYSRLGLGNALHTSSYSSHGLLHAK